MTKQFKGKPPSLAQEDIDYFSNAKTWLYGPNFHAVLVQKNQSLARLIENMLLDEAILEWNVLPDSVLKNQVRHCIISTPTLTNPVGARIFQGTHNDYSLSYLSIPTQHMERICGVRWAYGQFDLEQMVALHNVLIHLWQTSCEDLSQAIIVLMDEAWAWPTKTEALPQGILAKQQIALHAGWDIESVLPTGYAVIPFNYENGVGY